jgi:hypothetical protein
MGRTPPPVNPSEASFLFLASPAALLLLLLLLRNRTSIIRTKIPTLCLKVSGCFRVHLGVRTQNQNSTVTHDAAKQGGRGNDFHAAGSPARSDSGDGGQLSRPLSFLCSRAVFFCPPPASPAPFLSFPLSPLFAFLHSTHTRFLSLSPDAAHDDGTTDDDDTAHDDDSAAAHNDGAPAAHDAATAAANVRLLYLSFCMQHPS